MTALPPGCAVETVTWGDVRAGDWVFGTAETPGMALHVLGVEFGILSLAVKVEGGVVLLPAAHMPARRLIPAAESRVQDALASELATARARIKELEARCSALVEDMQRATAAIDAVIARGMR